MNDGKDDTGEPFGQKLKWLYRSAYRWWTPLKDSEINESVQKWRERNQISAINPEAAGTSRCCVMHIPGVGTRCSSEPANAAKCRDLARSIDEGATANFYPNPCVNCQKIS